MKKLAVALMISAMLAACGEQAATTDKPDSPGEIAAEARHEKFESIGDSFKVINQEAKKPAPDAALIKARAAEIATLAEELPTWFPAGSGPQDGVKTDALEAVWTDQAKFAERAEGLKVASAALRDSDDASVVANAGKLGAACKACHDSFRKKD